MKINWSKSMIMGLVKLGILAVLNENKLHGYEILKKLEEKSHGCCSVSVGSVYPALKELKKMNLISGEKKIVKGRKRIIYEITKEGRDALKEGLSKWGELNNATKKLFKL
jgi:DNA-binding PadR family transcriptional regulator